MALESKTTEVKDLLQQVQQRLQDGDLKLQQLLKDYFSSCDVPKHKISFPGGCCIRSIQFRRDADVVTNAPLEVHVVGYLDGHAGIILKFANERDRVDFCAAHRETSRYWRQDTTWEELVWVDTTEAARRTWTFLRGAFDMDSSWAEQAAAFWASCKD